MLHKLSNTKRPLDPSVRPRFQFDETPRLIYAIGDVHGCLSELIALEKVLMADARARGGRPVVILLGDYVDRGPHSKGVLEYLSNKDTNKSIWVPLAGNHDDAMQRFLSDPAKNTNWLDFGGDETLASYGFEYKEYAPSAISSGLTGQLIAERVPHSHLSLLQRLPVACQFPDLIFVHAGLEAGKSLESHTDADLMWTRRRWQEDEVDTGRCVVQGHIAGAAPRLSSSRIILDTGCYKSGCLTAGRFVEGRFDGILSN